MEKNGELLRASFWALRENILTSYKKKCGRNRAVMIIYKLQFATAKKIWGKFRDTLLERKFLLGECKNLRVKLVVVQTRIFRPSLRPIRKPMGSYRWLSP